MYIDILKDLKLRYIISNNDHEQDDKTTSSPSLYENVSTKWANKAKLRRQQKLEKEAQHNKKYSDRNPLNLWLSIHIHTCICTTPRSHAPISKYIHQTNSRYPQQQHHVNLLLCCLRNVQGVLTYKCAFCRWCPPHVMETFFLLVCNPPIWFILPRIVHTRRWS